MICVRNYKIENIKIILMFCVILGHLLEFIGEGYNLYKIIYSFHMPLFLFVNGWCAPYNRVSKRTLLKLIYPYILFQTLYQIFNVYVINEERGGFSVQFGTPYWLLWYLLALTFYYLLIPMIATENRKYAVGVIGATIMLSVGTGFDNSIGYYMSLSRTFVYLPFFVFGYYLGHNVFKVNDVIEGIRSNMIIKMLVLFLIPIVCMIVYKQNLSASALYGSLSYAQGEFSWFIRLELIMIAFTWSGIFILLTPEHIMFGRLDTFPVYVMHGFIVLFLRKYNPFTYSLPVNLFMASLVSITIMLVFGNKYVSGIMRFVFRGEWIIRIWDGLIIKRTT